MEAGNLGWPAQTQSPGAAHLRSLVQAYQRFARELSQGGYSEGEGEILVPPCLVDRLGHRFGRVWPGKPARRLR